MNTAAITNMTISAIAVLLRSVRSRPGKADVIVVAAQPNADRTSVRRDVGDYAVLLGQAQRHSSDGAYRILIVERTRKRHALNDKRVSVEKHLAALPDEREQRVSRLPHRAVCRS